METRQQLLSVANQAVDTAETAALLIGVPIMSVAGTLQVTLFEEQGRSESLPREFQKMTSCELQIFQVKKDDAQGLAALLDNLEEGVSWED